MADAPSRVRLADQIAGQIRTDRLKPGLVIASEQALRDQHQIGRSVLRQAVRILEETKVDLIFSDIVMPGGMSGIDLALLIRERWPEVRVLLTSGFSETLLQERMSAEAAPLRLLNKPYRQEDLASAIRGLA